MKYYVFYDTNVLGDCNEDFDIRENDYVELLKVCFNYSSYFSFMIAGTGTSSIIKRFPPQLEKHRIEADESVDDVYSRYSKWPKEICCYVACSETYNSLLKISDSIFKWRVNCNDNRKPEDLAFFRKDGSTFLKCVTHEGVCSIYPRPDEDIVSLLSKGNWYIRTTNHTPMTIGGELWNPQKEEIHSTSAEETS